MVLSRHFVENWRKRVGNEPSVEIVQQIMREGVIVQKPLLLRTLEGRPHKQLGIYWEPRLNVIVTIDEFKYMAVSVLSERNGR